MTTDGTTPTASPVETTSSPTQPTTPTTPTEPTAPTTAESAAPAFVPLTAEGLTAPEGFTLDTAMTDALVGIFNNQDLTPQQRMQELINLQAGLSTKSDEARSQAWEEQRQAWVNEITNDPEIGGPKLPATIQSIGTLMDRYADDAVRDVLNQTGLGDNPAIVKFFHKLSTALVEAKPASPGTPAAAAPRSLADRIYGN